MLFIIDMQNEYIDQTGEKYIKDSEHLVDGIIEKIKEYEEKNEYIFYTTDISQENKNNISVNDKESVINAENQADSDEKWSFEPYGLLKPYLKNHKQIKKSYYALPPDSLAEIQNYFKSKEDYTGVIEFVGVETHICVLANAICIQSAFPAATIVINSSLCKSNQHKDHEMALEVMENLGMEIRR